MRQVDKVYVQDVLSQQTDLVWSLISQRHAHFYVAGSVTLSYVYRLRI